VRQFSIRRNEAIAVHVTVRGKKALDILERGLRVKEFELERNNFSTTGACSPLSCVRAAVAMSPDTLADFRIIL
jgi:hypothetical protein